jgi:fluoroquinolone resistance protein
LQEVSAAECNLRGAKFLKSNFFRGGGKRPITHAAQFNACNFSYADMASLSVSKCTFRGCQFTQTIMEDANFSDANLEGSSLSDCEMRGANFAGVNLTGGKLDGMILSQLSNFKNLKISASEQESLLAALGVKVVWED